MFNNCKSNLCLLCCGVEGLLWCNLCKKSVFFFAVRQKKCVLCLIIRQKKCVLCLIIRQKKCELWKEVSIRNGTIPSYINKSYHSPPYGGGAGGGAFRFFYPLQHPSKHLHQLPSLLYLRRQYPLWRQLHQPLHIIGHKHFQ